MGLVAYASTDEDSEHEEPRPTTAAKAAVKETIPGHASRETSQNDPTPDTSKPPTITPSPASIPASTTAQPFGPQLGPQPAPHDQADLPEPLPEPDQDQDRNQSQDAPSRSLIHNLTLPSVPNLSIPPSPPSSPPPLLTSKLETFLALKRKGTHFNSKLLASASLRNPSLMDKLLAYVDIDDADQYQTTLAPDLWDANALPEWAFRDRLRKTREKVAKKKEAEKAGGNRTAVEFVPAANASGASITGMGKGGSQSG